MKMGIFDNSGFKVVNQKSTFFPRVIIMFNEIVKELI